MWEWAIWGRDNLPKVHFLKITFLAKSKRIRQTRLFNFSGLSLFRASSSIKRVTAFLDYCLSTRREFEKVNKVPFDEARFLIGEHEVQLFGNFPSDRVTFYGSAEAKNLWLLKSDKPCFVAEYALHGSVSAQLPRDFSLHGADPPFANVREACKHYFATDIGEQGGPWVGIVLPVHLAYIDSFKNVGKKVIVELQTALPPPRSLFLSVVCHGQADSSFRRRVRVTERRLTFQVGFRPSSLDLALYLGDWKIDFVKKLPTRRDAFAQGTFPLSSPGIPTPQQAPLFDPAFLDQQPNDVRLCLELADKCAAQRLWIPASLILRKALDMAVNLKMKQLGRGNELYDEQKNEKSLPARLQLLADCLPVIRREMSDLLTIKWFGDKGAHSKMEIYEKDIRSIVEPCLRAFLTDLEMKRSRGRAS